MPIVCSSSIDQVTIYARGAVVTRVLRLPAAVPDGEVELELPGITALAEPGSLRLSVEGPRLALGVRALMPTTTAPPAEALPEQLRELRHRIDRLRGEAATLEERRSRLGRVLPRAGVVAKGSAETRARVALSAGKLIDETLERLDARAFEVEEALREAQRRLAALELAMAQQSSAQQGPQSLRTLRMRLGGSGKVGRVAVTYVVAPARWWPLYTLRVSEGGRSATLSIEALVAQLSGEDWSAATLSFATADLVHDARLPQLPALRLGRAQPPARTGYRAPPTGLDQLFAAHDRYFPDLVPPRPIPEDSAEINYTLRDILRGGALTQSGTRRAEPGGRAEELDEDDLEVEEAEAAPRFGRSGADEGAVRGPERARRQAPPAPSAAAPALQGTTVLGGMARLEQQAKMSPRGASGGGPSSGSTRRAEPATEGEEGGLEPQEKFLDFSRLRLGSVGDRQRRGRLFLAIDDARSLAAMQRIEGVVPPLSEVRDPRQSRGQFAYRYEAAARGTVPSDGVAHLVPVTSAQAAMRTTFRAVPREGQEVYREAQLTNPFEAPLLAGPAQIYVDGSLLTTANLDRVGKGGVVRVGLGVEPRLRAARNVQVQEGASGLLGGSTVMTQTVRIELASSLGYPAEIEVLERHPVSDDKQIVVERLGANPDVRAYDQRERGEPVRGGLRWNVTLAAGGQGRLEHSFRVTLPAKFELSGGNRRD